MYVLFMYDVYEPYGGWYDFAGVFKTVEEARKHWIWSTDDKNAHVVYLSDTLDEKTRIVAEGSITLTGTHQWKRLTSDE